MQFFKVTEMLQACAYAQSGIKALAPLQNSHTRSVVFGGSLLFRCFEAKAAYCDRERGTLHRGAWSAGAPPDYSIAGTAINQETEKWLGAGKWGYSNRASWELHSSQGWRQRPTPITSSRFRGLHPSRLTTCSEAFQT